MSRRTATLKPATERSLIEGARFTDEFHTGQSRVQEALAALAERLDWLDIPYAIVGALALNAYGYRRATVDIDLLLTRDGLERFRAAALGRGYEEFAGSRGFRDAARKVDVDVVLTGDYPGDGAAKPVRFPDPAAVAVRGETFALLPLEKLVELKIASGMTAPHRLRDLADVIELIRVNDLPPSFGEALDPYVRDRYQELWRAAQISEPE
jgi:hypothetical protein